MEKYMIAPVLGFLVVAVFACGFTIIIAKFLGTTKNSSNRYAAQLAGAPACGAGEESSNLSDLIF